ncbi:hypothetical protein JTB14_032397 [Gonioctena quinquepunctata]|nr:hypothetical protein JTB14_032397 [Gonioctena quinquepunctata]
MSSDLLQSRTGRTGASGLYTNRCGSPPERCQWVGATVLLVDQPAELFQCCTQPQRGSSNVWTLPFECQLEYISPEGPETLTKCRNMSRH